MYGDLTHEMARLEQAGRLAGAARRRTLRPAVARVERLLERETARRHELDGSVRLAASDRGLLLLFLLGHVEGEVTAPPVDAAEHDRGHRCSRADERLAAS